MKMNLKSRLVGAFVAIALLDLMALSIAIQLNRRTLSQVEQLKSTAIDELRNANYMAFHLQGAMNAAQAIVANGKNAHHPEELEAALRADSTLRVRLDEFKSRLSLARAATLQADVSLKDDADPDNTDRSGELQTLDEIDRAFVNFDSWTSLLLEQVREEPANAEYLQTVHLEPLFFESLQPLIKTYEENSLDGFLNRAQQVSDAIARNEWLFMLLGIVASVIAGFLGLIVAGHIIRPLLCLTEAAKGIMQGDWRRRIVVRSRDEIGLMGSAFNDLLDHLHRTTVSKDLVETIIGSLADALIVTDLKGVIRTINPAAERLSGYSEEELHRMCVADIMVSGIVLQSDLLEEVVSERRLTGLEEQIASRDGTVIPVEISAAVMEKEEGDFGEILWVLHDVSDRVMIERDIWQLNATLEERVAQRTGELEKSKTKYQQLFEAASDAIIIIEPDNEVILEANHRACEVYGFPREEFVGMSMKALSVDVKHGESRIHELMESGELTEFESIHIRSDGTQVHFLISAVRIEFENRDVVLCINRDISERIEAEEALKRSENLYRHLIEQASDVIYRTDKRGRFTYVNSVAPRILGYEVEELIGMHYTNLLRSDVRYSIRQHYMEQLRHLKQNTYLEFPVIHKSGREVWLGQSVQIDWDGDGISGFQALARDVTERRRAEKALQDTVERERHLIELRSRFISTASHEFRTPLSMIRSSTQLVKRLYRTDLTKAEKHLDRIAEGVDEMTMLLDDVLVLGKADAGKLPFNPELLDIGPFIADMVEEIQSGAGWMHRITIAVDDDMVPIMADRKLLRQMLNNLITNAVKYSSVQSEVRIRVLNRQDAVLIEVADSGIGIPEVDVDDLFQPFHRATNVGDAPGTGLGLAIVKRAADLHGAKLTVESKLGVGTTVRVEIAATQPVLAEA